MGNFRKHSMQSSAWRIAVLWVDNTAYVGPDRRLRRSGLRLLERRRTPDTAEPMSLVAAVRHLRVRVGAADHPEGVAAFCRRARAVALLANGHGNRAAGDVLMGLVRRLESPAALERDPRQEIFTELDRLTTLLTRAA
jgi:hypothetical protein